LILHRAAVFFLSWKPQENGSIFDTCIAVPKITETSLQRRLPFVVIGTALVVCGAGSTKRHGVRPSRGGYKEWPLLQWRTRPLPYGPRRPLMKIDKKNLHYSCQNEIFTPSNFPLTQWPTRPSSLDLPLRPSVRIPFSHCGSVRRVCCRGPGG